MMFSHTTSLRCKKAVWHTTMIIDFEVTDISIQILAPSLTGVTVMAA